MARGETTTSANTIRQERGHSSLAMMERRYLNHRARYPHRSEVVEYRMEQHQQAIMELRKVRKIPLRLVA